jgi:hypothetical protein
MAPRQLQVVIAARRWIRQNRCQEFDSAYRGPRRQSLSESMNYGYRLGEDADAALEPAYGISWASEAGQTGALSKLEVS